MAGKCQERGGPSSLQSGLENPVCLCDLSVDSLTHTVNLLSSLWSRGGGKAAGSCTHGTFTKWTAKLLLTGSLHPLKEGQGWEGACKLRDMLGARPLPSFEWLPGLAPYKLLGAYQVFNDLLDALSGRLHTFLGTLESHFVTLCARPREANHHPTVLLGDFPQDLASSNNKMTVVLGVHQHVVFHHIILQHGDKRKKVKDQR